MMFRHVGHMLQDRINQLGWWLEVIGNLGHVLEKEIDSRSSFEALAVFT